MPSPYTFADPRLAKLDGFEVEMDEAHERADIVLGRPPYNVVSMPQRDQLRLVFETLDEDERVRVIVLRAVGEHFSSGGSIGGFMEASPEKVSKLAWNIASPARCVKYSASAPLPIRICHCHGTIAGLPCATRWTTSARTAVAGSAAVPAFPWARR